MSARRAPNSTEFATWAEAEALVDGWLSVRPYPRPNNRAGAPDMLLARDGRLVVVWVRPGADGLTKAQVEWAEAITGSGHPTAAKPTFPNGSTTAVLIHPDAEGARLLRSVMA